MDEADTLWVREFPSNQVSKNLSDFQKMEAQMNETLRKKLLGRQMQIFPAKIGDVSFIIEKIKQCCSDITSVHVSTVEDNVNRM